MSSRPLPLLLQGPATRALLALVVTAGLLLASAVHAPTAEALSGSNAAVALVPAPGGNGYAVISAAGGQYNYGGSGFSGSLAGTTLNKPIVGAAAVPGGGDSKWFVAADGGVFGMGSKAAFYGSMGGKPLNSPVVGMAATPSGKGYWLVAADGGIFTFGDAGFYGSTGGKALNKPVVGMAATPSGGGYWLVAADGGIFTFGDAGFYGSMGGKALNKPVVSVIASPTGKGYVLVGADGGTFTFGDYPFPGSLVGLPLNAPIVSAARYLGTTGLWLVGADGGVFTLTAPFYGSATGEANTPANPSTGVIEGDNGGRVFVACPAGGSIQVAAQLKTALTNLLADAKKAGYGVCGSGWRSSDSQIALRKQNCGTSKYAIYDMPSDKCSPETARPGTSMHERGLAIDFSTSTAGYSWLKANSSRYGLSLLTTGTERWHFSTNGR